MLESKAFQVGQVMRPLDRADASFRPTLYFKLSFVLQKTLSNYFKTANPMENVKTGDFLVSEDTRLEVTGRLENMVWVREHLEVEGGPKRGVSPIEGPHDLADLKSFGFEHKPAA